MISSKLIIGIVEKEYLRARVNQGLNNRGEMMPPMGSYCLYTVMALPLHRNGIAFTV